MAGPTLGTLLIQRLDAALGTTLSQQTQIVNRATADPVTTPSQATRPEPVSNTLVRDARTNVDRATLGTQGQGRVNQQTGTPDSRAPGSNTIPTATTVTTSATTSLGLAARIILNLFAGQSATTPPITSQTPLLNTAPGTSPGPAFLTALATLAATPTAPATGTGAGTSATPATPVTGSGSGAGAGRGAPITSATSPAAQALQPGPLLATSAIITTPILAQALARVLAQNLQQSGLFYESHLKSLASGQYRSENIRQEPQAQIPTSASRPDAGIDPATHGIVRQQLESLADQSINWRGEAWPGAAMDWHIRRHPDNSKEPQTQHDNSTPWQSEITIQLPQLGSITMGVSLADKQVHVTLETSENSAPILREHVGELRGNMANHQLELASVTFRQADNTNDSTHPETEGQP